MWAPRDSGPCAWMREGTSAGRAAHPPVRLHQVLPKRSWVVGLAVAVILASLLPPPLMSASSQMTAPPLMDGSFSAASQLDPSGIELVREITQAHPTSEKQAQAFDDAMQFASAHPTDVGYPWIDPAIDALVVSTATPNGRALLAAMPDSARPNRIRDVTFSYGQLEGIKDEVTTLAAAGVPDADLIYQTAPDHKDNRVIITVSQLSERLLKDLATRYGTEAIAVQVDPDHRMASTASRLSDTSAFWGGARINVPIGGCTSGFPWLASGVYAMLTAAHCAPNGGSVSTPAQSMGNVTSASEENWSTSTGTRYYSGQSTYRGDVALIRIPANKSSGTSIYRGPANSSTSSTVKSMWSRSPVVGDGFYTGGSYSGELGSWTVTVIGMNKWYIADGFDVWARNVTEGSKSGICIQGGDSGGPVFTLTTGGVSAKGIISGMGFTGCYVYFTDIRLSYFGLPGALRTG